MSNIRSEVEKQARGAIIQYAFLRWENAVLIGITMLLMVFLPKPFPGWPTWGWPALSIVGVSAIAISSLTDAEATARVLQELYKSHFNPRKLLDLDLRREMEQALEYQQRIETHTRKQAAGPLRDFLEEITTQLANWISHLYALTVRLDAYRHDPLVAQEQDSIPRELASLTARLEFENETEVRNELQQVIESKQKQREASQTLQDRINQATLHIEKSLTSLALVCNQAQHMSAQDVLSGRTDHIKTDIETQVMRLEDLVTNINEVYNYYETDI